MKGAIFFASKYGSTAEYARWIAEATGLPAFDVTTGSADPSDFDFLVLGSPILYFRLLFRKWVKAHRDSIAARPAILFSVSGAPAGPKLDAWIAASSPDGLFSRLDHVALRGRQDPKALSLFDRVMLKVGGMMNRDPVARRQEMQGFDFVDKSSIAPVVQWIRKLQRSSVAPEPVHCLASGVGPAPASAHRA